MFAKIGKILGGVAALRKILNVLANTIRDWRRKRTAKKSQTEFDAVERNPRRVARRMFNSDKDAD